MDIDTYMEEKRSEEEKEYRRFMNSCKEKITDGDVIYRALALFIAKHFKIEIPEYGDIDGGVYAILNHYVRNIDEDFEDWINKENGPMIRPMRDLRKIFKELNFIKSDKKLMEKANRLYNLEMKMDSERKYFYALQFDFNSFTPINVKKVHELKEDKRVLEKYGLPTDEVDKKLEELKIPQEIMEVL